MSSTDPPAPPTTPAEQTVVFLEFCRRWDTPLDDEASLAYARLVRGASDFATFAALAPVGGEARRLFRHHIDSFEEAAGLIRGGQMSEDLFFDGWYALPQAWDRVAGLVRGMRDEAGLPGLYAGFEWLGERARAFWAERAAHPPHWQPIQDRQPTAGDRAVFAAFQQLWLTPRDPEARAFVDDLAARAPDYAAFAQMVQPGSAEYIKWDRYFCAYDQAGTLVKNGILHPVLLFAAWRRPSVVWAFAGPWITGLRAARGNPHVYENLDWLVAYEATWEPRGP